MWGWFDLLAVVEIPAESCVVDRCGAPTKCLSVPRSYHHIAVCMDYFTWLLDHVRHKCRL